MYKYFTQTKPKIIIIDKFLEITWNPSNRDRYISLGYEYTKHGDKISVRVEDIHLSSNKKISVQCPLCQNIRLTTMRKISSTGHSYCGKCSQVQDVKNLVFGKLTPLEYLRDKKVWRCKCECGNNIEVLVNDLKTGHAVSCGYHKRYLTSMRKGKSHPNWNPNLTDDDRKGRHLSFKYKQWRLDVFNQGYWKCYICHSKTNGINAHHLFDYSSYPELQCDINNGVILCNKHHKDFHINFMGHWHNSCTATDFENYIQEVCGQWNIYH